MARKERAGDPNAEIHGLLRKLLMLRLFEFGVPQGDIARKLNIDIHVVNDFLKGMRKPREKTR